MIFAIQASAQGDSRLSTSQTFSSLVVISLVTNPAETFLQSLPMIAMAVGCLERVQFFLLSESCDEHRIITGESVSSTNLRARSEDIELQNLTSSRGPDIAISIEGAVIRPSPTAPPAVNNIDFQAKSGSSTMVIGVVGSGKSTLLKAIIGELPCDEGQIRISSKHVAYCSQTPWLPNATVRQLVCGYLTEEHATDDAWYSTVMHACVFDEDVLAFPDRDETIIGSRGVVLSGGQKQRLVSQQRYTDLWRRNY